jgi:hypothetical protein
LRIQTHVWFIRRHNKNINPVVPGSGGEGGK